MKQYVYIIKCGNDRVKIGISNNPSKRLEQIQTGNPDKCELVSAYQSDDARETETILHSLLSDCRLEGEWFKCSPKKLHSLKFIFLVLGVDKAAFWANYTGKDLTAIIMSMLEELYKIGEENAYLRAMVENHIKEEMGDDDNVW